MAAIIDSFLERPTSHKIIAWLALIGFLTFLFWQYLYSGMAEELTKLQERRETLETQVVNAQRLARNLDKIREEVRELDVKLNFAMQELPDKQEIPDLLSSVSDLATSSGLEVSLFKTRPENFKDFYAEVPVTVSVDGTFHEVATFFDEVGHLSRIVNIDQVSLKSPQQSDDGMLLKVDCTATAFRFLDESERMSHKEKTSKKRRRGK